MTIFGLGLAGVGGLISGLALISWVADVWALVGAGGSVTGAPLWSAGGAIDGAGADGDAGRGAERGSLTA